MPADLKYTIWRFLDIVSHGFSKLGRVLRKSASHFEPQDLQEHRVKGSTRYDMVRAPDEPYYADQYWRIISAHIGNLPNSANCLDLGCSQGRLTLRLANHFEEGLITACDISEDALQTAIRFCV